jgi:PST family polysaccharide transporter
VFIVRHLGFEAAGIYQAATALSTLYCGFIVTAMGADLLPRLSSVAASDETSNRLVNEQIEVGMLLALPGICATLTLAPAIVAVLYSGQFGLAADVLRWQILGVFLRVASWPMGYLLLARRQARLYFWTELSYNALHAGLIWLCVRIWGLPGTGIAFLGVYVYYSLLMSVVSRRLTGLAWSASTRRRGAAAVPILAIVFACPLVLPSPWHFVVAGCITAIVGLHSLRTLARLSGRQDARGFPGWSPRLRAGEHPSL